MKARWLSLIALSVLLFNCGGASAASKKTPLPRFVRLSLAGKRFDLSQSVKRLHDAKSGYYLQYGGDGAGRIQNMILELCPDADQLEDYDAEARPATLPRLCTGTGVNIGDTPQQVRRKLGAPLNVYNYGGGRHIQAYMYSSWVPLKLLGGQSDFKWLYNARYTFHNGRLWAIRYTLEEPDTGDY